VVAVVDDDDGMRQAMRRVLETAGFATEGFSTAEAFVASGAASRAACLVVDIHLPGMSGFELHERLRATGRCLPTVFVTGHATNGMHNCLIKPFPAETLLQAVRQSIDAQP
jgi:FixJ family two-component response regulator